MRTLQVYMRHLFALQVDLKQLSFSTDDTSGKSSCSQCETFFVWIDLWVTVYFPFASCTAPIQPFGSHPPTHHCVCPQNQSLAWSSTGSSPGNSSQISRFIPGHLREVGHTEESQIQTILILQILQTLLKMLVIMCLDSAYLKLLHAQKECPVKNRCAVCYWAIPLLAHKALFLLCIVWIISVSRFTSSSANLQLQQSGHILHPHRLAESNLIHKVAFRMLTWLVAILKPWLAYIDKACSVWLSTMYTVPGALCHRWIGL